MSGFTEAWYRDYQAKRGQPVAPRAKAAQPRHATYDAAWQRQRDREAAIARGEALKPPPARVEFVIRRLLKLPNTANGRHWTAGMSYRAELLPLIADATSEWAMCEPIQRARVTITRCSVGVADEDNLHAAVKGCLDILLERTETHPHSLGLLVDDDPARIELDVRQERVAERRLQRTIVVVEALS